MIIKRLLTISCGVMILSSAASAAGVPYGAILAGAKKARNHQGANNSGYCDYSNASYNGGWGWNPVTNSSCPPAHDQGYCDFSEAANNGGWGWNPVSGQSCR